jgi:transposase
LAPAKPRPTPTSSSTASISPSRSTRRSIKPAGRNRPGSRPRATTPSSAPVSSGRTASPLEDQKERFEELLEANLRTAKAWAYKEQMVEFWQQPDADAGNAFFHQWYRSVMHSRLPKMKKVAKSLKAHLGGLLTYFRHRITNALTEGFNSKIQAIKADARGFRRFEDYRTGILFFCGKLDMMPRLHSPATHTIP